MTTETSFTCLYDLPHLYHMHSDRENNWLKYEDINGQGDNEVYSDQDVNIDLINSLQ